MTGSTPAIIMIVVAMITLAAWNILVFMPMLILSGGVGHLPDMGVARQTARPAAPRQEERARAARPARQRHQLRLGGTREHPPRQRPGSMRAGQKPTDSGRRHRGALRFLRGEPTAPCRDPAAPEWRRLMRRDPGLRPRRARIVAVTAGEL